MDNFKKWIYLLVAKMNTLKAKAAAKELFEPVTERLRKLSPRVTAADVESLVKATEEVQAIGRANAKLRRELGLDE